MSSQEAELITQRNIERFEGLSNKLVSQNTNIDYIYTALLQAYERWIFMEDVQIKLCISFIKLADIASSEKISRLPLSKKSKSALENHEVLQNIYKISRGNDTLYSEVLSYLCEKNKKQIVTKGEIKQEIERVFKGNSDTNEQCLDKLQNRLSFLSGKLDKTYGEQIEHKYISSLITTVNRLLKRVVKDVEQYQLFTDAFDTKLDDSYKCLGLLKALLGAWYLNKFEKRYNISDREIYRDFSNKYKNITNHAFLLKSLLTSLSNRVDKEVKHTELINLYFRNSKLDSDYGSLTLKYLVQLWSERRGRLSSEILPRLSEHCCSCDDLSKFSSFEISISEFRPKLALFLQKDLSSCVRSVNNCFVEGTTIDQHLNSILIEAGIDGVDFYNEFNNAIASKITDFESTHPYTLTELYGLAEQKMFLSSHSFFKSICFIHSLVLYKKDLSGEELFAKAFEHEKAFLYRTLFLNFSFSKLFDNTLREQFLIKYNAFKNNAFKLSKAWLILLNQVKNDMDGADSFAYKNIKEFFKSSLPISGTAAGKRELVTLSKKFDIDYQIVKDFPLNDLKETPVEQLPECELIKNRNDFTYSLDELSAYFSVEYLESVWSELLGKKDEEVAYQAYLHHILHKVDLQYTEVAVKGSKELKNRFKTGNYLEEFIKPIATKGLGEFLLDWDESFSEPLNNKLIAISNIIDFHDNRFSLVYDENGKPIKLGKGGFGYVYKFFDEVLHSEVAIKLIPKWTDSSFLERKMLNEAVVMRQCRHENVVTLYDVHRFDTGKFAYNENVDPQSKVELESDPYVHGLIMEYIDDARTLKDYVLDSESEFQHFSFKEKLEFFLDICKGVEQAHLQSPQIIHGDIKPENILIDKDGVPKLIDFGISSSAGSQSVGSSCVIYSSKNIIEGNPAKVQDDIYSLGMVLLYILFPKLIKEPRLRENLFDSQQELIYVLVLLDSVCNAYWDEQNANGLVFDDEGTLYGDLEEVITKIPRLSCSMLFDGVIQIIRTDYPYGIEVDWPIKAILKAIVYQQPEEALLDIKEVLSRSSKDYFSNSYESVLEFRYSIASLSGSNVTFPKRVKFGGTLVSRSNLSIIPTEEIFDEDFPKNVDLNEVTVLSISNDFNIGFAKHPQLGDFKFSLPKEPKIKEKLQDLRTLSEYFYKPNQLILETASLLFKKGFDNQAYRNLVVLLFEGNELIKLNCVDERLANLQLSKVHSGFYSRSSILAPLIKKITEISEAIIAQNKFTAFVAEINSLSQELIELVCKCYERADSLQEFHQSTKKYSKYGISSWAELIYAPNAVVIRKYITQVLDRIHWNGYSHNSLRKKSYTLKNWEILTLLLESSLHDGSEFLMQSIVSEFFENGAYKVLESDLESVGHMLLGEPRFSVYEQCLNCLSRVEVM